MGEHHAPRAVGVQREHVEACLVHRLVGHARELVQRLVDSRAVDACREKSSRQLVKDGRESATLCCWKYVGLVYRSLGRGMRRGSARR